MIRLGLCCKFLEEPIRFRTTTARYLFSLKQKRESPLLFLNKLCLHNAEALERAIEYCSFHHIGSFRISSRFLPLATHPEFSYSIKNLPNAHEIETILKSCKQKAKKLGIRLTFHPDQFVLLSSSDDVIIQKSLADIEYHTALATHVGADVINIHGGGGYGDKKGALKRFASNFSRLSKKAQRLLTVENDDRVYTPSDLLPLCKDIEIPLVYDAHHHRCLPDNLSIEKASMEALKTWNREPLFHISSPLSAEKFRPHHDYIDPGDVPSSWKLFPKLTIEVEAKGKERAVFLLRKQLKERGWPV